MNKITNTGGPQAQRFSLGGARRRWVLGSSLVVVAAAVAAGWAWRGQGGGAQAAAQAKAGAKPAQGQGKDGKPEVALEFQPREIVQPSKTRMAATVEFSGPLVAPGTAVLRAKAAGTLMTLTVAEGSRVAAGQVIGRIDTADIASRVAERGAQLEAMRAALVQAERAHASNERLAAQNFISSIALENSKSALDTARANLNAAQASLETSKVALRDAAVVAPIAGIVSKRQALAGERVAMEQPIVTIVDLGKLELAGSIGTHEVSRVSPGLEVQVNVEGLAQPVTGRVARIAPAAEPGTRSIGVTIELANPKELLRGGQYAVARATLADPTERLTLPASAVGNTSGQDHVWLIEGGALVRRAVTVGRRDPREGRVEILTGVGPEAQVLGARFDNLREGAKALVAVAKPSGVASVAAAAASSPQLR